LIACSGGADRSDSGAVAGTPSHAAGDGPSGAGNGVGAAPLPGNGTGSGSSGIAGPTTGDIIGVAGSDGPFESMVTAANAPAIFTAPRAGVPLEGEAIAFIALDQRIPEAERAQSAARSAVFLQRDARSEASVLYAGAGLVSPLDIEASLDGRTLYVADFAGGRSSTGAIVIVPTSGGSARFAAEGWSPRSVTVGPRDEVYFSGVDPATGAPGVFALEAGSVRTLFTGAPLVDPSGIAVFADGRVLVADTRAFDARTGPLIASEASVVLIDRGQASVFATGFASGFPAGLALTLDESTLIVSGEGRDRSDTVWLIDVAHPERQPKSVTDTFSRFQDAAAGLKRAHGRNTFIFASIAADGGTLFRIEG
jgi:DNA-binding beta-propeller fold protein YncE